MKIKKYGLFGIATAALLFLTFKFYQQINFKYEDGIYNQGPVQIRELIDRFHFDKIGSHDVESLSKYFNEYSVDLLPPGYALINPKADFSVLDNSNNILFVYFLADYEGQGVNTALIVFSDHRVIKTSINGELIKNIFLNNYKLIFKNIEKH